MKRQKILIVDDDVDLCGSLKVILEQAGYDLVTATSRSEGMEKIRVEQPDLIILDAIMETWQDGFEMSRELRGDPQFRNTPILMLTSLEEQTGIEMESAAGDPMWLPVDAYLDKPPAPNVLLAEAERLLQGPQGSFLKDRRAGSQSTHPPGGK